MIFSDWFVNPAYMVAGALLISVPIIIHLINRMRYKRLRWAAMEFLLKSQKRNRRRLIIEQLILLALRCLLILLAGLLVARFIGNLGPGTSERDVEHLVVLDDTLSMSDTALDDKKKETTSFEAGKKKVIEIAEEAYKANSTQFLRLVLLSDIRGDKFGPPRFDDRLNNDSISILKTKLGEVQQSLMHVKPIKAVQWAKKQQIDPNRDKMLHFVSDLRESDWTGSEVENLNNELADFSKDNKVLLYDVAFKFRTQQQAVAPSQDNIAITDLRPESRFTAPNQVVQFTATLFNSSLTEKKGVFLWVKVDGEVRDEASQPIDIKSGESRYTFTLPFNKVRTSLVTATLDDKSGVQEDNTRACVLQVKPEVPILMIDGSDDDTNKPEPGPHKDSWYLEELYKLAKGYKVIVKSPIDLNKKDFNLTPVDYPCLYLIDVPNMTDEVVKKIEDYVEQGGRVAIFLGKHVQATFYNNKLYNDGNGIFPVPLDLQPKSIDEAEHDKRVKEKQYQVYLRDELHPVLKEVADPQYKFLLKSLVIDTYWPTKPRTQWHVDPLKTQELMTLPKRGEVRAHDDELNAIKEKMDSTDAKFLPYKKSLVEYKKRLIDAIGEDQLHLVAGVLDQFLNENGKTEPDKVVDLTGFWAMPDNAEFRAKVTGLRDSMRFGDPLMLSKLYGKGETIVFMTTAGAHWNNWGTNSKAVHTYPLVMLPLQKYLTGVTTETSRTVGAPLEIVVDPEALATKETLAIVTFQAAPRGPIDRTKIEKAEANEQPRESITGVEAEENGRKVLRFSFGDTNLPGLYHVTIKGKPRGASKPEDKPAQATAYDESFVYNVDAESEGKLKRASRDALERNSSGQAREQVSLITPDMGLSELLAPKHEDLSEAPWLYLIILIVLIVEQALAVHLSFHLKGSDAQLPPGVAGEGRTPVPAADAA